MKLNLFDFDGTLFKSPEYKPEWWDVAGEYSWFSEPISLTEPCVPLRPSNDWWIEASVRDAKKALQDPDAITIICTGRVESHRPRLISLLQKKGLRGFDGMFFNPGMSAKTFKVMTMEKLHKKHDFDSVHIWENENYDYYKKWVEGHMGVPCTIHVVSEPHIPYTCDVEDVRLDNGQEPIKSLSEMRKREDLRVAMERRRRGY